ncbi:MAG TPA: hypothetical protein VFS66_10840 [Acidimicrobiia bacterium]|nr:hypothetical protein [Acidimicrobiia bacterium]
MLTKKPEIDSFTQFVIATESKLRQALMAACGSAVGRDVAQEALEYGWEHWQPTWWSRSLRVATTAWPGREARGLASSCTLAK